MRKRREPAGWASRFVFLMVLREGAELALILPCRGAFSSEGLETWIGRLGDCRSVAVGLFFLKKLYAYRCNRFFSATSVILMLWHFNWRSPRLHELSEARIGAFEQGGDGLLGPIVRNAIVLFVFIFGAATLLILREWQAASHSKLATTTSMTRRSGCGNRRTGGSAGG